MNKLSIVLVVVIVTVGAWLWWMNSAPVDVTVPAVSPVVEAPAETSPTSDIDADLGAIDVGSVDADLQSIDADVNSL